MDWKELFGSDDEEEVQEEIKNNVIQFESIPGLTLIKQGLAHEEQMTLTYALINNHKFSRKDHVNQSMCFGRLPSYLHSLSDWMIDKYSDVFPNDILNRKPLFDQAILNLYEKGEGICSHVDLLRFEDGILIVSLLSSCVMTMRPATILNEPSYQQQGEQASCNDIDILLHPGDVLALCGDARYNWEHGIKERLFDDIDGQIIQRGTRLSITLRKLKSGEEMFLK